MPKLNLSVSVRPLYTNTPATRLNTTAAAEATSATPTASATAAAAARSAAHAAAARPDPDEGADGGGAGDVPDGQPSDAAGEGAHTRVHGGVEGQPMPASR